MFDYSRGNNPYVTFKSYHICVIEYVKIPMNMNHQIE